MTAEQVEPTELSMVAISQCTSSPLSVKSDKKEAKWCFLVVVFHFLWCFNLQMNIAPRTTEAALHII